MLSRRSKGGGVGYDSTFDSFSGDGNEGELRLSHSMTSGQKKCPDIGTMNTDGRNYIVTNIM